MAYVVTGESAAIRFTTDETDSDLVENRRRTGRPGQRPMLAADPPAQLPEAEHRVARDGLLAEIARAAAAAGRDDLPRDAEAWFPATPLREGRPKPPELATQRALYALLKESYPDRWLALVHRGRSLLASVRRVWTEGE